MADIEDAMEMAVRKLAHVMGLGLDEAQHYYDLMDPIDQRLFLRIATLPDDPNEWQDITDEHSHDTPH